MQSHICWMFDLVYLCIWPQDWVTTHALLVSWRSEEMDGHLCSPSHPRHYIPDPLPFYRGQMWDWEHREPGSKANLNSSLSQWLQQNSSRWCIHTCGTIRHVAHFHTEGSGIWPIFEKRSCYRFQADLKCKILLCQPGTGITKRSHEDARLPHFWNDQLLLSLDTKLTYQGKPHSVNGCDTSPLGQTIKESWGQGTGPLAVPQIFLLKIFPKLFKTQHLLNTRALLWGQFSTV